MDFRLSKQTEGGRESETERAGIHEHEEPTGISLSRVTEVLQVSVSYRA